MAEEKFLNNKEEKRYELHVDGSIAVAEYIINSQGVVYLTHTEVPEALEGRVIASRLIEQSLTDIKENKQQVFPLCPFVKSYIAKNPKWATITKL